MGNFSDLLHRRDVRNALEFALDWTPHEKRGLPTGFLDDNGIPRLRLESKMRFHGEATSACPVVEKLTYAAGRDAHSGAYVRMERKGKGVYASNAAPDTLVPRHGKKVLLSTPPTKFYGFPDDFTLEYQNADYVRALNFAVEQLASRISYLGPIRKRPSRLYHWSETKLHSVGYEGEMTVGALLANATRGFSLSADGPLTPMHHHVAAALQAMGLIHSFKVDALNTSLRLYEVKVKTSEFSTEVNLPDVGFGISQVLPVLVQCFSAPENSILLIEQPELHLHPKAQAGLANVLASVVRGFENGRPRNIQLIIETHSEHLLRRFQRLIAEDRVDSDQVACYNVFQENAEAKINPLQVTGQGYIENWPQDFFGDAMGEAIAHRRAAMRKHQRTGPIPAPTRKKSRK